MGIFYQHPPAPSQPGLPSEDNIWRRVELGLISDESAQLLLSTTIPDRIEVRLTTRFVETQAMLNQIASTLASLPNHRP